MINRAVGNANDDMLESEGEAFRLIKAAQAYSLETRDHPAGDKALFLARFP